MTDVPDSHPRRASLLARQRLVDAAAAGMLADSALIAHGRGEAFDYLLGEATCAAAVAAIGETAARLLAAEQPIISLNGNAVVLTADDMIRCAAVLQCPIEINIYYRTEARMQALESHLRERRTAVAGMAMPAGWPVARGEWRAAVESVAILGQAADGHIPGLSGPRATCCADGILVADAILVPLEDGDRCAALVALGRDVLVIDLNPISRTARTASVSIVDEVSRAASRLLDALLAGPTEPDPAWNNDASRHGALEVMLRSIDRDAAG